MLTSHMVLVTKVQSLSLPFQGAQQFEPNGIPDQNHLSRWSQVKTGVDDSARSV